MKQLFRIICLAGLALAAPLAIAQSASTNGISNTSCSQTSNTLVCTTTTTVTLPSGTNLTGMTLPTSGGVNGPGCSGLGASPSTVPSGVTTAVLLSVSGCPTSNTYTYTWGAPVASATGASTTHAVNLTSANPTQNYSVTVCLASNSTACATYSAAVNVQSAVVIPALNGCAVTPAASNVSIGGTTSLAASCSAGTGSGSNVAYQWSKGTVAISGATSSTYNVTASDTAAAGAVTYSAQISNGAPSSAVVSATVTAAAAVADNCPSTPVRVVINASEAYRRFYTSDLVSSFTAGQDFVVALDVTDADTTVGRQLATAGFADFGAVRGGRYATVSRTKCDYSDNAQWISGNFLGIKTPANGASASTGLNGETRYTDVKLTTGRWYINIQNVVGQCPSNQSCHAVVQWSN